MKKNKPKPNKKSTKKKFVNEFDVDVFYEFLRHTLELVIFYGDIEKYKPIPFIHKGNSKIKVKLIDYDNGAHARVFAEKFARFIRLF